MVPRGVLRTASAVLPAAGAASVAWLGELPPYGVLPGPAADGLQAARVRAALAAATASRGRTVLRRRLIVRRGPEMCMSVPFVGPPRMATLGICVRMVGSSPSPGLSGRGELVVAMVRPIRP